ncbi:hypothetical protein HMPREF1595_01582 [Escherichia coli 907672]|nr:hypothetical protein HMPREF1595_01582 [Escherichia coli 907672]
MNQHENHFFLYYRKCSIHFFYGIQKTDQHYFYSMTGQFQKPHFLCSPALV